MKDTRDTVSIAQLVEALQDGQRILQQINGQREKQEGGRSRRLRETPDTCRPTSEPNVDLPWGPIQTNSRTNVMAFKRQMGIGTLAFKTY